MIVKEKFYDAWLELLTNILWYGPTSAPRGKPVRELMGVSLRVEDMTQNILVHPTRALNYRFMVAEWLWIALGRGDLASLLRYNSKIAQFSDNGTELTGAYGPRLDMQWKLVLEKLRNDPHSRQAVATIFSPTDLAIDSKDVPCTLNFQYLVRENRLNCIGTMRSSDIWLGLPYDFFNFSMLANGLAAELNVLPGWLQLNLGSSHLYEEHESKAKELTLERNLGNTLQSPHLPHMPRSWMNEAFDDAVPQRLNYPWFQYQKILQICKTSKEALDVLDTIPTFAR